jgi:hypothetical protein
MAVRITPKSTQHTGMSLSTEGSVAAWEVTFHLDGDESLHAAISIRLAGSKYCRVSAPIVRSQHNCGAAPAVPVARQPV